MKAFLLTLAYILAIIIFVFVSFFIASGREFNFKQNDMQSIKIIESGKMPKDFGFVRIAIIEFHGLQYMAIYDGNLFTIKKVD